MAVSPMRYGRYFSKAEKTPRPPVPMTAAAAGPMQHSEARIAVAMLPTDNVGFCIAYFLSFKSKGFALRFVCCSDCSHYHLPCSFKYSKIGQPRCGSCSLQDEAILPSAAFIFYSKRIFSAMSEILASACFFTLAQVIFESTRKARSSEISLS